MIQWYMCLNWTIITEIQLKGQKKSVNQITVYLPIKFTLGHLAILTKKITVIIPCNRKPSIRGIQKYDNLYVCGRGRGYIYFKFSNIIL